MAARNGAVLHLYCCIGEEDVAADAPAAVSAVERTTQWLKRLAQPAEKNGLTTVIQVEWNPDWRERLAAAARASKADVIIKTASRHTGLTRRIRRRSDWMLLRSADCPVLLIDPTRPMQPKTVLAAVKVRPDSEEYTILNEKVLLIARRIALAIEGELHAVTVYKGEEMYFDRQRFADRCGLPRNRVHSTDGAPHTAIAEIAGKIGADIIVIGRANRAGPELKSIIGDTADKIIDEVNLDLVVVPPL
jgi:universal stress protein E